MFLRVFPARTVTPRFPLEDFANLRSMPALKDMPCPLATALPPQAYARNMSPYGAPLLEPVPNVPFTSFSPPSAWRVITWVPPSLLSATNPHPHSHTLVIIVLGGDHRDRSGGRWIVRRCLASGWSEELGLPDEIGHGAFVDCEAPRGDFLRWRRLYDHAQNLKRLRFILVIQPMNFFHDECFMMSE